MDVPAPDVNTDEKIMGWMVDEASTIAGHSMAPLLTGKPIASEAPWDVGNPPASESLPSL